MFCNPGETVIMLGNLLLTAHNNINQNATFCVPHDVSIRCIGICQGPYQLYRPRNVSLQTKHFDKNNLIYNIADSYLTQNANKWIW